MRDMILPDLSDEEEGDDSFLYLRSCRVPYNRINDSSLQLECDADIPDDHNFRPPPHTVLKFVDDFLGIEKLCLRAGSLLQSQNKPQRTLHTHGSEDFFRTVSTKCQDIGMTVNSKETQMLTISASNEEISSYIKTQEGDVIRSQESLKISGFVFGRKPGVGKHVRHLMTTFRSRFWLLRHLKSARIPTDDLAKLYQVLIVPTLDYATPVYHSQLSQEQSNALEKMQSRALKIIYGFDLSYEEILEMSGIKTLWTRRERLMDKFIVKLTENPRFSKDWLPQKQFHHLDLRTKLIYQEKFARTERLYRSPKYFIRIRLNEKRYMFKKPD